MGIECLLTDDARQARDLARTLDGVNAERRDLQQAMVDEAEAVVARIAIDQAPPAALCLYDPDWHPGVVGLVASRIKDRLNRPVIAFAPGEPGGASLRGSARSIAGVHVRDALAAVDCAHPGLICRFGGHAMAAGLSLRHEAYAAFEEAFRKQIGTMLDPALLQAELWSDGELEAWELDRRHAELLRDGGPWGQGYPEPLFDGLFEVKAWRIVGDRHLKLELAHGAKPLHAIQFGGWTGGPPPARVRIAYRLVPDDYRGGDAFQLQVVHLEPAPGSS